MNEKLVKVEHAAGHQLGMRVPQGGSDCAKCEYLKPKAKCGNNVFIRWQGSNQIPAPIDCYCCDEFEPSKDEEKLSDSSAEDIRDKANKALKARKS